MPESAHILKMKKMIKFVRFGWHKDRVDHSSFVTWKRHGMRDVGTNGMLQVRNRRVFGWVCWWNTVSTPAWCAFVEVFGFYAGIHRIDGENHNWVF